MSSTSTVREPRVERPKNRLLAALPPGEYARILPNLKSVVAQGRVELYKHGEPIRFVYFPNGGVWSVLATLSNGAMVEVATIGDEGMLGIEAFFTDRPRAIGSTILQVPDTSVAMLSVDALRCELREDGAVRDLVGRYAHAFVAGSLQVAACNAVHDVNQRCARWLLMTHDRMHGGDFRLSHELLATMLGVRRQTVSEVAAALQLAGSIRYTHGHITVVNRQALEAFACECYPAIRAHFDSLRP